MSLRHCHGVAPSDGAELRIALRDAFAADRSTVIRVREDDAWLQ